MPGQPQLGTNDFFGVNARDVVVLDPAGGPSNLVIRRSDEFKLQVTLKFGGYLAPLILCCLCWRISYCIDVYCGDRDEHDDEGTDDTKPVDRTFRSPIYCAYNYPDRAPQNGVIVYDKETTEATVPANSLYAATYKLTASARFYCRDEQHRAPYIAAFTDGPVIQITD